MNKTFDKERCLKNLRALLKHSTVKLGDLEKQAGVRIGYLSRVEKNQNSTPSIKFITTAASMLNVSLDALCYDDLESGIKIDESEIEMITNATKLACMNRILEKQIMENEKQLKKIYSCLSMGKDLWG